MSLVTAKDFFFANISYRHVDFPVGEKGDGSGALGVIGHNNTGQMAVEYDLANEVIRLFVPKGCDGARLAYRVSGQQAFSAGTVRNFVCGRAKGIFTPWLG
jgi:hypothetical protein